MLKTAFIGNENFYDRKICEWLSEHTDLSLIVWSDRMTWSHNFDGRRRHRTIQRFRKRASKYGGFRAINEVLYYLLYRTFLLDGEVSKIKQMVGSVEFAPKKPLSEIEQIRPENVNSDELFETIRSRELDAMFAMCIDVYLPNRLIDLPRLGTFLWHEGITPEYRGVYSPFWALANKDYDNLGYTLLRMNHKLDAGDIYLQGKAKNIDIQRDWHSYIGHKAVLDSLPQAKGLLAAMAQDSHTPLSRPDARDAYYSYPTASKLVKLALQRRYAKLFG